MDCKPVWKGACVGGEMGISDEPSTKKIEP
jgi:hypothetical protein